MVWVDSADVLTPTSDLPDAVVRYASHADGIIDLHLPPREPGETPTAAPLVVLLHGGFWRTAFDRNHTRPLSTALAAQGFVVAAPEYRRVGAQGDLAGGWPTTFEDVSSALHRLPDLLSGLGIPVRGTTVVGHSAGGHLAHWLANEDHPIDRVVALAPVGDLRAAAAAHTGQGAVPALLGGMPAELPERYDAADPATRLATRPSCEVIVVHGADDDVVPVANSQGLASRHGHVRLHVLDGVEHFGVIDPLSRAWPVVHSAVRGDRPIASPE